MMSIPVGESATLTIVVTAEMTVHFDQLGAVHPVYATYSLAKHFEEAGRLLLLRYLGPGEAGIGSAVSVEHLAPSWVGDTIRMTARCTQVRGNRLTCACCAVDTGGREVGRGTAVQAVLAAHTLQRRIGEQARETARAARPGSPGAKKP